MSASTLTIPLPAHRLRRVSVPITETAMPKYELVKTKVPGVYARGARYVYTYRVEGRQRWRTADTLDEARRLKRQAEVDVERGELVDLTTIAFGEYALEWITNYQGRTSNGFRERTRIGYRRMLVGRVIPYFDGVRRLRLAEITPRDVKAFVRWMAEQEHPNRPGVLLAKSTVRQNVAVLRALLGDATEEGLIRSNPAAGVRVSVPDGDGTNRPAPGEKRALTIDELRRLLEALPEHYRLLFEFLAHTGLRIGEATELRWGRDVVLDDRPRIKVRWQWADDRVTPPKTRYGKRDVPLSPGLTAKLAQVEGADGELVFTTPLGRRLDRHNLLAKVLQPAGRHAGLPWIVIHSFRHTCASLLFTPVEHGGGGKNAKQVQEWLGHHSPAYTLSEYVHLVEAGVGDAAFFDDITTVQTTRNS